MIARLLISPSIEIRLKEIKKLLLSYLPNQNHPDLLYIKSGGKLGIAEARKITGHFSLKPYSAKGKIVVIEDADDLTPEAQNALLKTIEELPKEAIFIIGASSANHFLPTILSRCEITNFKTENEDTSFSKFSEDLEKLINSPTSERFEYVEKTKDKEAFLHFLTYAFRQMLYAPRPGLASLEITAFLDELLQAEKWAKQNVNIRAILEYLMLVMPKNS